jgi:PAS domain S-box-containing protein
MFVGGPGGEVFEANDYFLNMLGRTRQALEAGQLNWKDHTTPDTLDTSVNNVMQMQATGGSLPYEKEYLHADGSQVSALVALSLLSKNPTRGVAIVVDISDRKAAQNALVQANSQLQERTLQAERAEAAKTLFLSSVSHELRTPLHTVLGYVRLLHKQTSGDVQQQLGVVEHSSSQLLKLIDDLLEFNHTTIAPERLEPEDVELQGFLANLESIGSVAAADSGNRFVCHLGSGLPSAIVVDERRLVQVLRILIDNACKYTRAGTVTLSLSAEQLLRKVDGALRCRLRFAVSDTGRGITKSDIRRIFEPLNRGSDVSDRPGLGLGLAIAEHWIARMGGCIAVESAPGLGSEFSFVLELDSRFEAGPAPREKWPDTRSATQVHDTPAQLQVLPADLLESLGKLIHMGRLGRLHEWAKDLQEQYPAHRNAAQQVAYLASHAEVDALIALYRRWAALMVNPIQP